MPEDIKVNKAKFDALLRRIAHSKPLAEAERKVGRPPRIPKLAKKQTER